MNLAFSEPVKLLEAHDQGAPLVRIDAIRESLRQDFGAGVDALDSELKRRDRERRAAVLADGMACDRDGFHLHGTLKDARR